METTTQRLATEPNHSIDYHTTTPVPEAKRKEKSLSSNLENILSCAACIGFFPLLYFVGKTLKYWMGG